MDPFINDSLRMPSHTSQLEALHGFDWAPCRGCGKELRQAPEFQTPHGIVCLECQRAPQPCSPRDWLIQRRQHLITELAEVESVLKQLSVA